MSAATGRGVWAGANSVTVGVIRPNGITRGVSSKCTLRATGCLGALVVEFVAWHTGITMSGRL